LHNPIRLHDQIMNHSPRHTVLQSLRRQSQETAADFVRRSHKVSLAKRLLPALGVLLLAALVAAPELRSGPDANRVAYHIDPGAAAAPASRLLGAKYHGTDTQGQPYTITADSAVELGADNVTLAAPMGDITLKSGSWLMMKSANGVYRPHSGKLELSGGVTLYRNDGTILTTADMVVDMHAGSAETNSPAAVQGPFGTLNAKNGFLLTNRGASVTFKGPATLVLTQGQ
jgi:lipopolysaccharide export system protein LptC